VTIIEFDDFLRVEMCTGTITDVEINRRARVPAYILTIDFGEKGRRISSAQLTDNYTEKDLVGKQIVAVMNFPVKRIAGIESEVLVLGALCPKNGTVLLEPTFPVANGVAIA
jgi:tRNA-binding protein